MLFINNTVEFFDSTIYIQDFVQLKLFQGSSMNFTNNAGVQVHYQFHRAK